MSFMAVSVGVMLAFGAPAFAQTTNPVPSTPSSVGKVAASPLTSDHPDENNPAQADQRGDRDTSRKDNTFGTVQQEEMDGD